jgi:ribonuclease P protein component
MRFTLNRSESLKSHKLIRLLFDQGQSEFVYPFKMLYLEPDASTASPISFIISVSKRKYKTAVCRNHIKRLFRESYRKQKHPLQQWLLENHKTLALAFIFVGDKSMEQQAMEDRLKLGLQHLLNKLQAAAKPL